MGRIKIQVLRVGTSVEGSVPDCIRFSSIYSAQAVTIAPNSIYIDAAHNPIEDANNRPRNGAKAAPKIHDRFVAKTAPEYLTRIR